MVPMLRDLQYGFRRLAGQKLFSISVVLLLAIGIGSNTVIFSLINSLLLKTLPVRDPGNLYLFQQQRERQVRPDTNFFYQQFEAIQQRKDIFSAAVAEQEWAGNSFQALSLNDGVHLVSTQIVSPNYFLELGVKPLTGRVLDLADASAISDVPVVISEQCWSEKFRRDAHILNRVIRIRNAPFVVVGVLPAAFHGIDADRAPDIRLPISAAPSLTGYHVTEPGGDYPIQFQILARLNTRNNRECCGERYDADADEDGRTALARLVRAKFQALPGIAFARGASLLEFLSSLTSGRGSRSFAIARAVLTGLDSPDGGGSPTVAGSLWKRRRTDIG